MSTAGHTGVTAGPVGFLRELISKAPWSPVYTPTAKAALDQDRRVWRKVTSVPVSKVTSVPVKSYLRSQPGRLSVPDEWLPFTQMTKCQLSVAVFPTVCPRQEHKPRGLPCEHVGRAAGRTQVKGMGSIATGRIESEVP